MILIFYFVLISLLNSCIVGDSKSLTLYWNVPTYLCQEHDFDFVKLLVPNTFKVNTCDKFQGDKIVVFRDPGLFPRAKQYKNGTFYCFNKCIPQGANLSLHLSDFSRDVARAIPDPNFNGLGVIQFEDWDPLFAFNNLDNSQWHRDMAIAIEKWYHKYPMRETLEELAERRFNTLARMFFDETIKLGQNLRPHAKWGYYNYPKCTNNDEDYADTCPQNITNGNDILLWLFNASDALFPTLNFQLSHATKNNVYEYPILSVEGRLQETKRLVQETERKPEIYPYLSLKFVGTGQYLNKIDIERVFRKIVEMNVADGVIMWLRDEDLDSKEKCERFYNLTLNVYLPTLKHIGIIPKK